MRKKYFLGAAGKELAQKGTQAYFCHLMGGKYIAYSDKVQKLEKGSYEYVEL